MNSIRETARRSQPLKIVALAIVCAGTVIAAAGAKKTETAATRHERLMKAFLAVWYCESGGQLNPPDGDRGKAVGPLQMWPIRVDDANRLAGIPMWGYDDRRDLGACFAMFKASCLHYHPNGTVEQWIRHWNGSPSVGPKQRATQTYGRKALAFLDRAY